MKADINYIKLDGRGKTDGFQKNVLDALESLTPGDGLYIIKEFEPLPLYALMETKGMDKHTEKISDNEFHVWFFPKPGMKDIEMKKHLHLDEDRIHKMLDIKLKVFKKQITPEEARKLVNQTFDSITPEEFAYGEQHMLAYGITNEVMVEGMDDIIDVFRDVLKTSDLNLPQGHPILTYAHEAAALEQLLLRMENKLKSKFIKNEWLELYEKLNQINIHFSRKQHQLFSALERKGFDRPSTVMWTFDNKVRDAIKSAYILLDANNDRAFIEAQPNVIFLVRDILDKERTVLYPTSLKLLSNEEFVAMRKSDDEIGYCLIETPPLFDMKRKTTEPVIEKSNQQNDLIKDLTEVLKKHGLRATNGNAEVMDVSTGKMTLDQINLVFKHLQIDLSYVDENDIVKFYSDTKHRVFPRSAGVIGRKVQNCHPRESLASVEAIIDAFRSGKQDKAEFWIEMGGKFIYIIYNAVRDDKGNFRGVLEMMQDATHIRSLTGSRKLLTWDNENPHEKADTLPIASSEKQNSGYDINEDTVIGPLIKKYPFIKDFLMSLNPKYKQLNNPIVFNTMGNIANLGMIAKRGDLKVNELIAKIKAEIERNVANP
jgi:DUF438 domain-containing protein/uncharacterized protein (DUF2249 family)